MTKEQVLKVIQQAIDERAHSKIVVIYHANCTDGFGAAWAVWRVLGDGAEYLPAQHDKFDPLTLKGDYCFVLDYSFDLKTLLEMQRHFKHVVVLDHHVSAAPTLAEFGSAIYDNDRSGAGIAWDSFHQEDSDVDDEYGDLRPDLIDYIEDRDLWRKKLDDCDAVACCTEELEHDFKAWNHYCEVLQGSTSRYQIIERGRGILEFRDKVVKGCAKNPRMVRVGSHEIPVVNCIPDFRSELANVLAQGRPFAAVWYQASDGRFVYSLRSTPDGEDVSKIAAQYGGGGHKGAAGFSSHELIW